MSRVGCCCLPYKPTDWNGSSVCVRKAFTDGAAFDLVDPTQYEVGTWSSNIVRKNLRWFAKEFIDLRATSTAWISFLHRVIFIRDILMIFTLPRKKTVIIHKMLYIRSRNLHARKWYTILLRIPYHLWNLNKSVARRSTSLLSRT